MVYRLGQRVKTGRSKATHALLLAVVLLAGFLGGIKAQHVTSKPPQAPTNLSSASVHIPAITKNKATTMPDTNTTSNNIRFASCAQLFPSRHTNLTNSSAPELTKLAQYEQVCGGSVVDRSSFFAPTPTNIDDAQSNANDIIARLKEYNRAGIKPLVFLEPTTGSNNIDLNLYRSGAYDSALNSYFASIKAGGITDPMMGIWVIMPEGNTPAWGNPDSSTFIANVTKTIRLQKKYFPRSQSSIMLDSETYTSTASWENGSYSSLVPYVKGMPRGLVDSFGIQGFPWAPPANQPNTKYYDPKVYLRASLASEAAKALGVSSIWFNTGTFNRMYTKNAAQTVTTQPIERQKMLGGVISQAKSLKGEGFDVSVHLFAEDKSSTREAIDWSYWHTAPTPSDTNTKVFTTFAHDAFVADIPLWLFDTSTH